MFIKISGLCLIIILFCYKSMLAQQQDSSRFGLGVVENGDTVIHVDLNEIWVMPPKDFSSSRDERRYNRYVMKVKKVLPYARMAGELLREYEPLFLSLKTDKERRQLMKGIEQQLLDEYKDDMKRMTISEGHILLKLIDRETQRTSYTLIKDFRGGISAFFWQGVARLFGSDLKVEYDPDGEDKTLEQIVMLIEVGYF